MKKRSNTILWLFSSVRARIPALAALTVLSMANAALGVLFALGTRGVVNAAASREAAALLRACIVQAALIAALLLSLTGVRALRDTLSAQLERDWKRRYLKKLLHAEYAACAEFHTAELLNRMNNDARAVTDGLLSTLPGLASMLVRLGGAAAALLAMSPGFTLAALGAGVLVAAVTAAARKRLKSLHKQLGEAEGKTAAFLQEVLEKLLLVQALDAAEAAQSRADALLDGRYALQKRRKNVSLLANTCVSALGYGAGFVTLVWCAIGIMQGRMTFGDLSAMTALVSQLQGPFVNLSGVMPQMIAMLGSCERLMELDALPDEPACARVDAAAVYASLQSIDARGLSFVYDREAVLEDVCFSIPKGSFTVITGESGAGKSTLLKLMLGVYHPQAGALTLRTRDGKIPCGPAARPLFAYVPQGNLLFSGTLRDNLTLARPDASDDEIRLAVYASCMDAFLPELPLGLDTPLGENATGLSEGQAQRVSIARAVLSGAGILLLDEATSALDAQTEREVLARLRALGNRTCIAVTHRPAALELAQTRLDVQGGGIRVL